MKNEFSSQLKEIDHLITISEFQDAFDLIDRILDKQKTSTKVKILCKIFKARIYIIIFPYSEAIKYAEEAYNESQAIEDKVLMFDSSIILRRAYFYAGEYEKMKKSAKIAFEVLESFDNKTSLEYLTRKATLPLHQGQRDKVSFNLLKESVSFAEKHDDLVLQADAYLSLGSRYLWEGDLKQSIKNCKKAEVICNKISYRHGLVMIYSQQTALYQLKGDLDIALDRIQKALHICREYKYSPYGEACFLGNLGVLYWQKKDLDNALRTIRQSISLFEESKVVETRHYPWMLLRLNTVLIELGEDEEVLENTNRIEQIADATNQELIRRIYAFSKAIYLESKATDSSYNEAITLLEKYVDDNSTFLDLTALMIFHLCDLYLKKITKSNDLEKYQKLIDKIAKLAEIAETQNSSVFLTHTLLLQSKLELIELNVEKGQSLLIQAQELAEEKGIINLAKAASYEYDLLLDQLSTWEQMSEKLLSLQERLELTHIEDILAKILKNYGSYITINDENEMPYFFLIMTSDGSIVFSEVLSDKVLESDLLQGLMHAIEERKTSRASNDISFKRFKYQEYSVVLSFKEDLIIIYTFIGQSYSAMQKLRMFVEKFQSSLNVWSEYFNQPENRQELTLNDRMEISAYLEEIFV